MFKILILVILGLNRVKASTIHEEWECGLPRCFHQFYRKEPTVQQSLCAIRQINEDLKAKRQEAWNTFFPPLPPYKKPLRPIEDIIAAILWGSLFLFVMTGMIYAYYKEHRYASKDPCERAYFWGLFVCLILLDVFFAWMIISNVLAD
jgi:hypothetical protein